jgi:hypothetical protein
MGEMKSLTRRELYDLVWSKPITKLAADFGISDVGLAKICDRYRVPSPSRGYWAKLEAGKKVKQAIFTEALDPHLNRIEIKPGVLRLPEPAREILKQARAERKAKSSSCPSAEAPVFDAVTEVHPTLRRTATVLRKAKPDANGSVRAVGEGLCGVVIGAGSTERVIRILDLLARHLKTKALPITPSGKGMTVCRQPDSATFTIVERTQKQMHVPTPEEVASEERRQKRLERRWRSPNPWDNVSFQRAYPEFDVIQTGQLILQVEGYGDGIRRSWSDGKTQRLESLIDSIGVGLDALLAVRKARREEPEERERKWQELSRRRDLKRRRAEREKDRLTYLNEVMELEREIEELRQWVTAAKPKAECVPASDFARLFNWAQQRLNVLVEKVTLERLEGDLQAKRLFPETDDLHDPLGDPSETEGWW